jgi:hypothetical protein
VLAEGQQLRGHHILQRHHADVHAEHRELLSAGDQVVVHRQALGTIDEVDKRVAVPRLEQPVLGRSLRPHSRLLERLQRPFGVLRLDDQVEIVARLRSPARPAGEAAAEQERDVRLAQRRRGPLERVLDVRERLLV